MHSSSNAERRNYKLSELSALNEAQRNAAGLFRRSNALNFSTAWYGDGYAKNSRNHTPQRHHGGHASVVSFVNR